MDQTPDIDQLITERLAMQTRMQITVRKLRRCLERRRNAIGHFNLRDRGLYQQLKEAEADVERHMVECEKLVASRERQLKGGNDGDLPAP